MSQGRDERAPRGCEAQLRVRGRRALLVAARDLATRSAARRKREAAMENVAGRTAKNAERSCRRPPNGSRCKLRGLFRVPKPVRRGGCRE